MERFLMEKFDIKSFAEGYLEALCSPARQFPHREPVAYLYGPDKFRLPPLPAWDKKEYPYAVLSRSTNSVLGKFAEIFASDIKLYFDGYHLVHSENGNGVVAVIYYEKMTEWEALTNVIVHKDGIADVDKLIWTNYDLLKEDGTIYMAASDPIPVYE
jgi:hypothetical protein